MKRIITKSNNALERASIKVTRLMGSTGSLFIHTVLFTASFVFYFFGYEFSQILLVVTTIVSLEAIYLSIFIQMSVNRQDDKLSEVALDVGEIQEDVEEIQKDVDEIQEDVDEIEKDVDEIQKDVDEIQEDVDEINEDDEQDEVEQKKDDEILNRIEDTMGKLIEEVMELKKQQQEHKK